jgi:hypothetical protein
MEAQPYIVVRDNDLARLEASVNERIDEGYSIAGPLFAVTPAQGGVLYVQPMVIEFEDTGIEEDMYDDEPAVGRRQSMAHGSTT